MNQNPSRNKVFALVILSHASQSGTLKAAGPVNTPSISLLNDLTKALQMFINSQNDKKKNRFSCTWQDCAHSYIEEEICQCRNEKQVALNIKSHDLTGCGKHLH
jgi:hypothetical protein